MYFKFNKISILIFITLFAMLGVMTACSGDAETTSVLVETAEATAVITVTSPSTITPSPTETAVLSTDTPTPEPTNTPSATPTDIPTETPTNTPSPTSIPTNTPTIEPTPTVVPATTVPPTAPPATAHTFPETPIQPFDVDVFMRYLGLVRDSYRSFDSEMGIFAQTNKPGDCGTFNGWAMLWILDAPGFTNVPAAWQPLYAEYRSMLQQIVNVTYEIRPLCSGNGGQVSEETTQAIFNFLTWAYPRSEAMIVEAGQVPR